ncbi:MAG: HtaA domain-containing protein [Actinomycetaceae bacterium]|nr:HtaA domain-containing protein [Actinomycetaceae bacterium]
MHSRITQPRRARRPFTLTAGLAAVASAVALASGSLAAPASASPHAPRASAAAMGEPGGASLARTSAPGSAASTRTTSTAGDTPTAGDAAATSDASTASSAATAGGKLSWSVSPAIRDHIREATTTGSDELDFALAPNQRIDIKDSTNLNFQGEIHFIAPDGELAATLTSPRVAVDLTRGTGTLYFTAQTTNTSDGATANHGQIAFAELSDVSSAGKGRATTIEADGVVLTAEGAQALGGYLDEGLNLDGLSVEVTASPSEGQDSASPGETSTTGTDDAPSKAAPSEAAASEPDTAASEDPTDARDPAAGQDERTELAADDVKPTTDQCQQADTCNAYFVNGLFPGTQVLAMAFNVGGGEVIAGDWDGDGVATLAIRKGNEFTFYGANRTRSWAWINTIYGSEGGQVLVGDFDGDGTDDIAVKKDNVFSIKYNQNIPGTFDQSFTYGRADDIGIVGDWDGDGKASVGVRRGNTNYLRNSLSGGNADLTYAYGVASDAAVAGDWDGDGRTTVAVRRGNVLHVRNSLTGGPANYSFAFGRTSDAMVVGDWDGDRTQTIAVIRP